MPTYGFERENFMAYDIKEFYDAENFYEYRKLCSSLFRLPIEELCDYDEYLRIFNGYPEDPDYIRLGAFHEGKLHAGIQFPWFTVNYDGNEIKMYGAGGVISNFNQPFKGAIKEIYKKAFELMLKKGAYISHLFPFADDYYRRFGYEISCEYALWDTPTVAYKSFPDANFVAFDNSDKMKAEIKEIYSEFAKARNMSVVRTEDEWNKFFESIKAFKSDMYTFISYTQKGADGFMSFSSKRNDDFSLDYHVEHMCFKTNEGLRGLLSYFATQKAYAEKVYIKLPADVDISPLIDSRIGTKYKHSFRKVYNGGQTRIISVEDILKISKYNGEGEVKIKIVNDTYCPWNNSTFTVKFGETTTVLRTDDEGDIEINANVFASAIMGRFDLDSLDIFPDVKINGNEENLRKVFYRKKSWIEERY